MALYGSSGEFLMDEEWAAMDVKAIREAKQSLEEAESSLKQALDLANSLKGYMAAVYQDKLMSLESVLREQANKCEDCVHTINNAISNNQRIAEEARAKKEQMKSFVSGPSKTRELADEVIKQNTNKQSLSNKMPEPAVTDLLGGLF